MEIFRRWGALGLIGLRYPEADGGTGMDKVADCLVREELSAVSQAFATTWSAHSHLALWPLWRAGTAEQKARYLEPGLAGEKIGAFALSEPDTGSNIRELTTKAEKVAGGYRLRGAKLYISNAPIANFMLVAARTRPELTNEAISLFIVDLPNPAVAISKLKKEGIRASETGLIALDDVFVADDALLGAREGTYPVILEFAVREPGRRFRQRGRHGARRLRGRARLRQDAAGLGQADPALPGGEPSARRHGGGDRVGALHGALRRLAGRHQLARSRRPPPRSS